MVMVNLQHQHIICKRRGEQRLGKGIQKNIWNEEW